YRVGPLQPSELGKGSDVAANNISMWDDAFSVGGSKARAARPTSGLQSEPAGALVSNGDQSGFITFDYYEGEPASSLGLDIWTGNKPDQCRRLTTRDLYGADRWLSQAVWVP